jgi:hypothetical protein
LHISTISFSGCSACSCANCSGDLTVSRRPGAHASSQAAAMGSRLVRGGPCWLAGDDEAAMVAAAGFAGRDGVAAAYVTSCCRLVVAIVVALQSCCRFVVARLAQATLRPGCNNPWQANTHAHGARSPLYAYCYTVVAAYNSRQKQDRHTISVMRQATRVQHPALCMYACSTRLCCPCTHTSPLSGCLPDAAKNGNKRKMHLGQVWTVMPTPCMHARSSRELQATKKTTPHVLCAGGNSKQRSQQEPKETQNSCRKHPRGCFPINNDSTLSPATCSGNLPA